MIFVTSSFTIIGPRQNILSRSISNCNVNDLIIRHIGKRFIEFSTDYVCFGNVYNFYIPESLISNFITRVSRELRDKEGEFRLVFNIVNQTTAEIEGSRLYTNTFFTAGVIQGTMNDRVKDFLYGNGHGKKKSSPL